MPKVSVIITTHNRPKSLVNSIESAFMAGKDVEVIVVDDASVDETSSICDGIKNIKYIRAERNQKTAGARNLGILASSAPYISFLDDDDQRIPNSLDWQVSILDKYPDCGLVYGRFSLSTQNGEILNDPPLPLNMPQGDVFDLLLKENFIGCLTVVFRKECLYKVGLLDQLYSGVDDWDLWIRIAELYHFRYVKKIVGIWRKSEVDSNQGSSDAENMYRLSVKAFREKWSQLPKSKNNPNLIKKNAFSYGKNWQESRILYLKKYNKQLEDGKKWLEQQHKNLNTAIDEQKKQLDEQKKQINETINGKEWLEQQLKNWKDIAEERNEYIHQLLEGKEWLEQQLKNWKDIAEERDFLT